MARIEDPYDLLSLLSAKYDPVRLEEELAKGSLKVFVLSGEGATLWHGLQGIDLR